MTALDLLQSFDGAARAALGKLLPGLPPVALGNQSGAYAPQYRTLVSISATDALILGAPTGGWSGARMELWITASGAARDLSFDAAIKVPTDSAATYPKTLTSGKTYIVLLRNSAGTWWLTSLIGGY